ncbi:MAG: mobilization protein [Clostridia bacterium BRH_c25]|nr:MAG: mobilization protein [Clostridia bacterium BRH_c25]
MLKRSIKITFRLNAQECQRLKKQVKKTGLSQESYLRTLINGYAPKELPPPDYYAMMKELHAIGNNLNQIAAKANATGHIDRRVFQYEANWLRKAVLDIQTAVTAPERRSENGDHSDMGCDRLP